MVPLLIIPQIIFGGMFLKFNELKSLNIIEKNPIPIICNLVHSRWAYEGYLNIFRYKNPAKEKKFRNSFFREKYGNLNNQEVIHVFRTYYLSQTKDKELKKELDENKKNQIKMFAESLRKAEEGKLKFKEFYQLYSKNGINFFPYYKKLFFIWSVPTLIYDLLALVLLGSFYFLLTLVSLKLSLLKRR